MVDPVEQPPSQDEIDALTPPPLRGRPVGTLPAGLQHKIRFLHGRVATGGTGPAVIRS